MARLATLLLIIGGLNWGLVGFFQFDLVAAIFGGQSAIVSRIVYAVVGIAAIYEIFFFPQLKKVDTTGYTRRIDRAA